MSFKALNYVMDLDVCEDGADLTAGQKMILFCLAHCHNPEHGHAWPSLPYIAQKSKISEQQARRNIHYLEAHGVLRVVKPERQGRGQVTKYFFPVIDDAGANDGEKGSHNVTLFSDKKRVSKGSHLDGERVSEGYQKGITERSAIRKNLEPGTDETENGARSGAQAPSARAMAMSQKNPNAVARFVSELQAVYRARTGCRESFYEGVKKFKYQVATTLTAASRCAIPPEVALALEGYTDQQIALLMRASRDGPVSVDKYEQAYQLCKTVDGE